MTEMLQMVLIVLITFVVGSVCIYILACLVFSAWFRCKRLYGDMSPKVYWERRRAYSHYTGPERRKSAPT